VTVIDRAAFPRDKVCAGWLTPAVFDLLELDPEDYRRTGLTLQEVTAFRTGTMRHRLVDTNYGRVVSYAIRRCEFDTFLLERSGATVLENTPVTTIRRADGQWIVNDSIATPVLIGAGGFFCPVARYLRGTRETLNPVVAKEAEFPIDADTEATGIAGPELFFCDDLDGYAWCVRKGRYLNVGIGRRSNDGFATHVKQFGKFLENTGRLRDASQLKWHGHAYFASGAGVRPLVDDGVLLIGDAAGLAYPESGEGIRPAIESGLIAARTLIAAGGRVDRDALEPYAEEIRRQHPPAPPTGRFRAATAAIGGLLLRSPMFTRHVVLDRWFLRA
jgi:flavin-dependent dehydrogenase